MNKRYIVVIISVLIISGGVLFFAMAPAPAPESYVTTSPETSVVATTSIFGEGSTTLGILETATGTSTTVLPTSTSTTPVSVSISRSELSKHNTQSDCWVGYKGIVYDLTSWLPRHPGSAGAILPYCGTVEEFTTALNRKHGTSKDGFMGKVGTEEGALNQ